MSESLPTWPLRNSERKKFKQCRFAWDLSYNQGWEKRRKSIPLDFGSMVHEALDGWYIPGRERGEHPANTFAKLYEAFVEKNHKIGMWSEEGDWEEAGSLGNAMLNGYVEQYGEEPHIEVISSEQPFQIDIHDPETGEYVVTAVGTFDSIVRDHGPSMRGKLGFFEHKTYKTVKTQFLSIDEQASTYWTLGPMWLREQGILDEGEDISFMMYNILRKAKPDERPRNDKGQYLNQNGTVSKRQPPPHFVRHWEWRDGRDRDALYNRLIQEAREIQMVRRGELAIYKNPTNNCPWMCDFFDVCETHEIGQDWEELIRLTCEPYDAYASHHEEAELEWEG